MRVSVATRDSAREKIQHRQRAFAVLLYLSAIVVAAMMFSQTVSGQSPRTRAKAGGDEKTKPRTVELKTKDGLELRAFYFPSDKGKDAVTVMLVHEWKGQGSPYQNLVKALHQAGCAVLVPEYRGHGGSKEYTNNRGEKTEFDVSQMSRRDVESIVNLDLEKAKGFLKDENNEELLNLNALVVIGVREGCVLATKWAERDWSFPSVGRIKQGQDVKALVLISPSKQIKGVSMESVATNPNLMRLPILIISGDDSPESSDANRIAKRIEGIKKRFGRGKATGFAYMSLPTALSGPALVNNARPVIPAIVKFVTNEVKTGDDHNPWVDRN